MPDSRLWPGAQLRRRHAGAIRRRDDVLRSADRRGRHRRADAAEHHGSCTRKAPAATPSRCRTSRPSPRAAHAHGAKVLMDNTWGIHFFQPFRHGVDVSIQALTKYAGGHSDVLLGSITVNSDEDWERCTPPHARWASIASPDDCWLALRGLRTMGVRLQAQMEARHRGGALAARPAGGGAGAASGAARRARPRVLEARLHRRLQPVRRRVPAAVSAPRPAMRWSRR